MSRILFAPLGSLGDLHPFIALATEMRQRGHSAVFCSSAYYQRKIEALGFEFHPMRPNVAPDAPEMVNCSAQLMNPRKGPDVLLRRLLFPNLRGMFEDLSRALASGGGADLLVSGEIVYAAPLIAEKSGVRWASVTLSPMPFFSAFDLPVLSPFPRLSVLLRKLGPRANRTTLKIIKRFTRSWTKPVRQLRTELGLPPGADPIYEGKFSQHLVLALFSPLFGPPQPDWPPQTQTAGFAFYDGATSQPNEPLEKFLAAGDSPIVFTLGSAAVFHADRFYHESAQAALLLNARAILLVGPNPAPVKPSNNIAVFDYLPYSQIFPRAAAIVHQCGIGTTAQGLRSGRPALAMPFAFDQHDNAARLVRLGVARQISRQRYTATRAASELHQILSQPSYRRNAATIAEKLKLENGSHSAANALEELLN